MKCQRPLQGLGRTLHGRCPPVGILERLILPALKRIYADLGVTCHRSNLNVISDSQIVVLAVKPQQIQEVLEELRRAITDRHLVISIAAGIPLRIIQDAVGKDVPLIWVMRNTPALVQKDITALAPGEFCRA